MKVIIKNFAIDLEIKNRDIVLEVKDPGGDNHQGDLHINKAHLIWCRGKTNPKRGKKVAWDKFIELMNSSG